MTTILKKLYRSQSLCLSLSFLSALMLLACLENGAASSKVTDNASAAHSTQTSPTPPSGDRETEQLRELLRRNDLSKSEITGAVKKLGALRAKEAIPELIKLLDFDTASAISEPTAVNGVKIEGVEIRRAIPISGRYPATEALYNIGEPSLEALIEVIEREAAGTVLNENALYTIHLIFREDLSKAVTFLQQKVRESQTENGKKRLLGALEKTQTERARIEKSN